MAGQPEHNDKPRGELTVRISAMPGDTNANGDIFGGWVLSRMDQAGGIAGVERAKGRVKQSVAEVAQQLIALYAARDEAKAHAFGPDTAWQRELEEAFPFVETPDQLVAIDDVKRDMEREKPMDRLVCGDVGFGKTEVAMRAAFKAVDKIHQIFGTKPGREGVFGDVTFSHDLIQYIGGQNDTNSNLTHRILLLLESKPVGRRDAYDRVIRAVLRRYLSSDLGWQKGRTPLGVPRFLFNDIARYWRTITVDYVYKQWTRNSAEWALKNAKLRMSRKLIYASGLLYCFSLADETIKPQADIEPARMLDAISRLAALTDRAPLDLLAEAFSSSPKLAHEARTTCDAYDKFLELMGDGAFRDRGDRDGAAGGAGAGWLNCVRGCRNFWLARVAGTQTPPGAPPPRHRPRS